MSAHIFSRMLVGAVLASRAVPVAAGPYDVTNTNSSGAGSLYAAITAANTHTGLDTIRFSISGTGVKVINQNIALPAIVDPVQIFGSTQTGYTTHPVIEINGTGSGANGLTVTASGCIIQALAINRFSGDGVNISGAGGNSIIDCFVGSDAAGTLDRGNGGYGVHVNGSPNNSIAGGFLGGSTIQVISGNSKGGVLIEGLASTGNRVTRCYVGTNITGTAPLGNTGNGITLQGSAQHNTIGATDSASRNVISGNSQAGIQVTGPAANNTITGNYIGVTAAGNAALANTRGVYLSNTFGNQVGGSTAGARNVISGNADNVSIERGVDNRVKGNYIGTNANGVSALGTNYHGVYIFTSDNNQIGGTAAGEGNIIGGNNQYGVRIEGTATLDAIANRVQGNIIGTNALGSNIANGASAPAGEGGGVYIYNATGNNIGGTVTGEGNVISANKGHGVRIYVFGLLNPVGNAIQGNFIGTTPAGTAALGNTSVGVWLEDSPNATVSGNVISGNNTGLIISDSGGSGGNAKNNYVEGNIIGLNASGAGKVANTHDGLDITGNATNNTITTNVISGNGGVGVSVTGYASFPATGNQVLYNLIGTTRDGSAALGNAGGILLGQNADTNTFTGNVISGNSGDGVDIQGSSIDGNVFQRNYIGTNAFGSAAVPNAVNGIFILDGTTVIGGTSASSGNIISGNTLTGLFLSGTGAHADIEGNLIGIAADGATPLGNGSAGVRLEFTDGVTVGGTVAGSANVISGNRGNGVEIVGQAVPTAMNTIQGNLLGTDASGTLKAGNGMAGLLVQQSSNNVIGGLVAGARNLISGNNQRGIFINATTASGTQITAQNLVEGNFIGTDISGTKPLGNSFDGVLVEDASTNTVGGTTAGSGNVISGNGSNGVNVLAVNAPATGNTIAGNLIGVSSGGATPLGNAGAGINLSGALNSIIGGATDSARNAISANGQWGIVLHDKAAGTLIQGNYIGTDTSGMAGLGNTFQGIFVENAPNNIIGGMSVGAGNVVSANHMEGIRFLDTDAHGNTVQGNFIGTKAGGIGALGNDSHGISIKAADSNAIGGSVAGSGNTIAYNGGDGVFLESGVGNAILHNSIEANAGLGIDLFPVGVTLNDAGDADPGANLLQNYPVLTGLSASGGSTTLHGRLSSTPNTTFVVELFVNVIGDPSGYGEGRTYLDSKAVTTGSDGNVSFADSFVTTFPANAVFTATATDPANNTSEFSPCFPLYGDVNSDGIVDNVDVVEILRAAGGLGTVVIFQNGDVAPAPSNDLRGFGDGRLDARDALRILRHIHGLEIQWP